MTYGWEVSCFKSIVDKLAGLELTARKNLTGSPAVIGPSGRNHCFRGESSLPVGIKLVLFLRQIRVSTMLLFVAERNMLSNDSDSKKMPCFKHPFSLILFREVTTI